ncbi:MULTISPECIES: hypothetical protein [unclassified Rhizobium]|uniref:hypothetical protein n=1 Tax=unclassified Rhizobium TaxID=2613769 RepID=UPI0016753427|nr:MULTISPECIES: hypothetical protein [unclassified Rhizobium]
MMQSLLLWVRSVLRISLSQPAAARIEWPQDGEPAARDYEIYYWNPSPGPWY